MISAKHKEIAENASLEEVNIKAETVKIDANSKLANVRVEAKSFSVGRNTTINDSIMLTKGDVIIGNSVQIKEGSVLNAFKGIKIGDNTIIDRGVIAAGMQSETSYLEIGSRCVVLHHSYVNTTREVIIGNNVGVGGYCMIFTHGVWQNAFQGYPFQFGRVEIKDSVWLPWHVIVMPGVTIGRGSTIAGGSVVTENVPEHSLAGGVPAKVIRRDNYPRALTPEERDRLAKDALNDFYAYMVEFIGDKEVVLEDANPRIIIIKSNIGNLVYSMELNEKLLKSLEVQSLPSFFVVAFVVPDQIRRKYDWIELESEKCSSGLKGLALEFASFIRRYGVRLTSD